MSDKADKQMNKKTLFSMLKWLIVILVVIVLEAGAIITAVKVTESRQAKNMNELQNEITKFNRYGSQIANLEETARGISLNNQKIAENVGNINLLTEDLNALKAEVGNNRLELLTKQMVVLTHRMESVEETKNNEALVLSLALIIKENALYQRSFKSEANILKQLSASQEDIQPYVQEIDSLKDTVIATDTQLIDEFATLAEYFSFEQPAEEPQEDEGRSAVSKSIKLIKDTVSNINFDKVVVMKKDKKTNEQKLLVHTLTELVKSHNFADAINFINQNEEFNKAKDVSFLQWKDKLQKKVQFDKAISEILAAELNAMRQDFADIAKVENKE